MKVDKGRLPVLMVVGLGFLVAGCDSTRRSDRADRRSTEPPEPACIDFDNLNVGDNHAVGATIPTSPYQILVEPFGLSGTPATWHVARVQGNNYASGSGAEINARNVNLTFQLTAQVSQIDMKIAELGGVNNIVVNGTMQNAQDLIDLNTTTVASFRRIAAIRASAVAT